MLIMLRKYILIIAFLFSAIASLLHASNLDTLKIKLQKAKEDTNKVQLLIDISNQKGVVDGYESINYSKEALALAIKLNYLPGKINACCTLGEQYTIKAEYETAFKYLNDALKFCSELKENTLYLAQINDCLAKIYYYKGDYKKALDIFLKNVAILENLNQKKKLAKAFCDIAVIQSYNAVKFDEPRKYVLKAKAIYEELNDTVFISRCLTLLADYSSQEEDYETALTYYKQSLAKTEGLKDKHYFADNLNGIGNLYENTGRYPEAIDCFQKVIRIEEELGDKRSLSICLLNLGTCYEALNNQREATRRYKQAMALAREIDIKPIIRDLHYLMTESYLKQGDSKSALTSFQEYVDLNASLFDDESNSQMNAISVKYEGEKKEKEIALLNNELILKQKAQSDLSSQVQQRNSIIVVTLVGAVLIIVILVLLFNRRRLIQQNKFQQTLTVQREQNISEVFRAQENEQVRIAKDLHDGVGIFLSTLKLNLQLFEKYIPIEKSKEFKNSIHLIDTVSSELRHIMKNLSNESLLEHGLITALEDLIRRVNIPGTINFEFHTHGLHKRIDEVNESNLYRIAQELITNCLKHSNAKTATLQLLADDKHITLLFEDDGTGFKNSSGEGGMGIKNIYKRVNFMKGNVRFETNEKNGTLWVIEIPNKI